MLEAGAVRKTARVAPEIVSITVTTDDPTWLRGWVVELVTARLIASATECPSVFSVWRDEDGVHVDPQSAAVMLTTAARAPEVYARAADDCPDDVAQVTTVAVVNANPEYARWIAEQTDEA